MMDATAEAATGIRGLRDVEAVIGNLRQELYELGVREQCAIDKAREQYDRAESAVAELARVTADLEETTTNLSLAETARDDLAGKLAVARASMLANEQELQRADVLIGDLRGQLASETARADAATLNGKAWEGTAIATMSGDFDALAPIAEGDCFRWVRGAHDGKIGEITSVGRETARLVTGDHSWDFSHKILRDPKHFRLEPDARPVLASGPVVEAGVRDDELEPFAVPLDGPAGSYRPDLATAVELVEAPVVLDATWFGHRRAPVHDDAAADRAASSLDLQRAVLGQAVSAVPSPLPVQASDRRPEKQPLRREPKTPKEPGPPPEIGLRRPLRLVEESMPRVVPIGAKSDRVLAKYLTAQRIPKCPTRYVEKILMTPQQQRFHYCQAVIKALGDKAPEQVENLAGLAKILPAQAKQAIRDLEGAGLLGKAGS